MDDTAEQADMRDDEIPHSTGRSVVRGPRAPSAAAERVDNERFVVFRGMMTRAASLGQGTTTYYLGKAGLELLAEVEWLRSRLVAWDHDLSATTVERDEALEERDDAQSRADGYALLVQELRAALEHAGAGLAGTYAYLMQRGDPGNAAAVLAWIGKVDAILAVEPEARASELLESARQEQSS